MGKIVPFKNNWKKFSMTGAERESDTGWYRRGRLNVDYVTYKILKRISFLPNIIRNYYKVLRVEWPVHMIVHMILFAIKIKILALLFLQTCELGKFAFKNIPELE